MMVMMIVPNEQQRDWLKSIMNVLLMMIITIISTMFVNDGYYQ